ncbi:MAG TPA: cation acetate symporter, partial [Verrucomicrobiae bacterium]|nr:cation acetate symporter [Verrucomicrobiae bacterium]
MKKLLAAFALAVSVASVAAAEPAKQEAAPAVAAPAAAAPGAAAVAPAAAPAPVQAAPAPAAPADKGTLKANPKVTIPIFLIIIAATMAVVVNSARKTKSASDFYTAGGGITGTQNGWAIAGDYMSAASFLGISGMISLYGYDGFMYSVG